MTANKTGFENSWQYKRILEILDYYWLNQPEEEYVEVIMYFRHKNGEEQKKHIIWRSEPTKEEIMAKLSELRDEAAQTMELEEFAEVSKLYEELLHRFRYLIENDVRNI